MVSMELTATLKLKRQLCSANSAFQPLGRETESINFHTALKRVIIIEEHMGL